MSVSPRFEGRKIKMQWSITPLRAASWVHHIADPCVCISPLTLLQDDSKTEPPLPDEERSSALTPLGHTPPEDAPPEDTPPEDTPGIGVGTGVSSSIRCHSFLADPTRKLCASLLSRRLIPSTTSTNTSPSSSSSSSALSYHSPTISRSNDTSPWPPRR